MIELIRDTTDYLPVPHSVWSMLQVNRAEWIEQVWAEWPQEIREEWMRLAKVSTDYSTPPRWTQIPADDRQRILRRVKQFREMYVASRLSEVWHKIAWAIDTTKGAS